MKSFNLFIALLAILTITLTSCEKENFTAQDSFGAELNLSDSYNTAMKMSQDFDSDYAKFKDVNAFVEFAKVYSDLNGSERQMLAKKLGYETFTDYFVRLSEDMVEFEDENQVSNYVNQHSDVLALEAAKDGSNEVVMANRPNHMARLFLNQDRILKVGDHFQKYVGDYVIYSEDYDQLMNVSDFERAEKIGLTTRKVVNSVMSNRNDIDVLYSQTITNDNSWCKNDRRIKFDYRMRDNSFTDINGVFTIQLVRDAVGYATRKGIPCVWYAYSTPFTWNDCELTGNVTLSGNVQNVPFTEIDETITIAVFDRTELAWGTVPLGSTSVTFDWTVTESRLTHQGMAGAWIEL